MNSLQRHDYRGYHLGAEQRLRPLQLRELQKVFERPPSSSGEVLAGRQGVTIGHLQDLGSVAVKHYARGGLVRYVNHSTYVNWRQTRGEKEYLWLKTVRQIGLAAPRPIAFASRGRFFGPCWLVMAAIPRHRSLIHVCRKDDGQREVIFGQLAAQIRILIRHGIWHRDLHPGNVLVDQTGTPHLIDFDKARYCNHRRLLTARYVKRWQRAIAKHGLPRVLAGVITTKTIGP